MFRSSMEKLIVLFGGTSRERLVSVASAQNIAALLPQAALYFMDFEGKIFPVTHQELADHIRPFESQFVPRGSTCAGSLADALPLFRGAVVLLALHGGTGENGVLQELFEHNGVAFTGSDAAASARCMDKRMAKELVRKSGILTAREITGRTEDEIRRMLDSEVASGKTFIAKPVDDGSSFGLAILSNPQTITEFFRINQPFMPQYWLIEECIRGREITVGVEERAPAFIAEALPPSEVVVASGHSFDYQGKYLGKGSTELTPAPLTHDETHACQELARQAHSALGCSGYSRTDMILSVDGPVFLETNTLPGLTKASFIPQQLEAAGKSMVEFLENQIRCAQAKAEQRQQSIVHSTRCACSHN
jgi:D-alanine-D-alanine ligase